MARDEHTLRMFLGEERPSAILVAAKADPRTPTFVEWLPRSLIGYLRKDRAEKSGCRQPITFTLPEWKIEAAKLWDYVQS